MHVCMCACVRVCVCACVRVRARARECVRVCMCSFLYINGKDVLTRYSCALIGLHFFSFVFTKANGPKSFPGLLISNFPYICWFLYISFQIFRVWIQLI